MVSRRDEQPSPAPDPHLGPFEGEALSYIDSVYRTALRLTRNPSDADDLAQETYLKAFRHASRFERGTNLKAWLFTILHNTYRNRLRDARRNPVTVDSEIVDRSGARQGHRETPEQILIGDSLDADLQAAVDTVPEPFREAMWLRDVEEFSYAEIAGMLQVPLGTVMSRISRGRRMLYDALVDRADRFRRLEIAREG